LSDPDTTDFNSDKLINSQSNQHRKTNKYDIDNNIESTQMTEGKDRTSENFNNEHFDIMGRRRHIEYIKDPDTGQIRPKTRLEQTGFKKPYRLDDKKRQQINWRRMKLADYTSMGKTLNEVSRILNIPYDTLYKDQIYLKIQAEEQIKNHINDLPYQIKTATDGLNKLISMLYDVQDLDMIRAQNRRTSDHVRVLAMSLMKECIKEKTAILTSSQAISHALDFVQKAKQQIKEEFNADIQTVIQQDKKVSEPINDAIQRNPELKSYIDNPELTIEEEDDDDRLGMNDVADVYQQEDQEQEDSIVTNNENNSQVLTERDTTTAEETDTDQQQDQEYHQDKDKEE
jgi:hypothetical protein